MEVRQALALPTQHRQNSLGEGKSGKLMGNLLWGGQMAMWGSPPVR